VRQHLKPVFHWIAGLPWMTGIIVYLCLCVLFISFIMITTTDEHEEPI
jgi:hypothetical protein